MSRRLIDADALKKSFDEHVYLVHHGFNETEYGCTQYGIHQIIDEAPTIDAEPVRHGKWIWLSCTYDRVPKEKEYECSECHHKTIVHGDEMPWGNYCPNCGARMDGERKEE